MSSSEVEPDTRQRIVNVTARWLERHPGQQLTMSTIAGECGLSRQAIYLHFADRTELMLEVSRQADAAARTPERQRRIDNAQSGREALRESVSVQAEIKPQLRGIATALDVLRRSDAAAATAWEEREHARLRRCRAVVRRLHKENELALRYSVDDAAQLLWAVTSQRVWDDLVIDQNWTQTKYRTRLTQLVEDALLERPN
jgi:AcrR family transcriptional regulator